MKVGRNRRLDCIQPTAFNAAFSSFLYLSCSCLDVGHVRQDNLLKKFT